MRDLTLVMIVRDEARSIARCIGSVRGVVDQIIVVDTGSTDDTAGIAARLGAKVHHIAWPGDFSAARNAALALSPAQWNLVLDADEWIDADADIAGLHSALFGEPFIGLIPVASEFEASGSIQVGTSWIPRILPHGVRYEGVIHEQPVSQLPKRPIQLPVRHDGYLKHALDCKKGRNETLLLRALAEAPDDPYLLYQAGKNYEVYGNFREAVAKYTEALIVAPVNAAFRHDLVLRSIYSLKKTQQYEQAIALADTEMRNWQHSPDFFFVLGDLLLDWAAMNPATAFQELLPLVESSWLKCLELGERPILAGTVKGRGSFLAAQNLAVLYAGMNDNVQAAHYRKLAAVR